MGKAVMQAETSSSKKKERAHLEKQRKIDPTRTAARGMSRMHLCQAKEGKFRSCKPMFKATAV
jgi:hypothetical protein